MKRIALHTLGCKLNYAETAAIGKQFTGTGYHVVGIDDLADVVVINTCSVTASADRECRQLVRRALRHSPDAFVAVVGCSAQLHAEQLAAIQGVDLVLGTQEKYSLLKYIETGKKKTHADIMVSCIGEANEFGLASSAGFDQRTRAFLKVQDGCSYSCSYCTIPLARGTSRSAPLPEIIRQAREAVELGYKELVLTGVNVGDYGRKDGTNLLALVKQLVLIDGLLRIRISSIEPNLLTDELLEFWYGEEKLCNHWHIPLQSGSDTILKSMRRRYGTDVFTNRVERIKSQIPDAGIGSDVIVGFPGESDDLFEETYRYIAGLPLTYLHVFSYSERPNTPASEYLQKVDPRIKAERSRTLHTLGGQKRSDFYHRFIGKTIPVLFESKNSDGTISGLSEEYIRVDVNSDLNRTNEIQQVTILEASPEKCIGIFAEPNSDTPRRIAI
ncbi:MAG: tRNA (N(6)-L-threonylcarbamoyladenosine(37)-C(2))-methylthiotransferase MtaB [Ignavibacteriae bacterium]|nr:MAG: tRNA (N(6)-L-threonylcarbamoyladenosine(37)-C(2))-methylthiotransferase MtaB [Ignavibacteriota bacterium]